MLFAPALLLLGLANLQQSPLAAGHEATQSDVVTIDPALEADIRRLLEDAGVKQTLTNVFEQMSSSLSVVLKANPAVSPAFVDEFMSRLKEKLQNGQLENLAVQEYAKFFTPDEIKQMIAFYESPIGRKIHDVQPQLQTELGAKAKSLGERMGEETAMEVARDHPEYLKKPTSGPSSENVNPAAIVGGVIGGASDAPPPPPPPPPPRDSSSEFSGPHIDPGTAQQRLIKRVDPVYPEVAMNARLQGSVRFSIVVGPDGKVKNIRLISGHPLLVGAAKDAVQQWVYKPVEMEGQPVRFMTEVQVNFNIRTH